MGIYCTSREDHIKTCIEDEIDVIRSRWVEGTDDG